MAHTGLLIFTPTWLTANGQPAMLPDCRASIEAQRIEGSVEWHIGLENPFPIPDHRNVLHQYQQARAMFLAGEWEALLTVEHDNVLPDPFAAQRLLETPGDVVYAPYLLRHGAFVVNTWQWINNRNLGMSLSHYPDELRRARESVVWKVSGAGFGCTLIRRRVLEAIEMTGPDERDPNACPDLRFAEAVLRAGFVSAGRFDVPVLHYQSGHWLHPFENRGHSMNDYIARETMNAIAAGRFVWLVAGQAIPLSDEEAMELNRIGAIEAPGLVDEPGGDETPRSDDETGAPQSREDAGEGLAWASR